MNDSAPITDTNDPRITLEDYALAQRLHPDEPSTSWAACEIANHRCSSICRAAGIMGSDPTSLEALVWYWNDRGDCEGHAKTWKDYAEELEKERDTLLEGRENALAALGMHPDTESVVLADEISRLRDENREWFHVATRRMLENEEMNRLNLELARLADEERDLSNGCAEPAPIAFPPDRLDTFATGHERLELEITLGGKIGWQDQKWHLFDRKGSGLTEGAATITGLIEQLSSLGV